MKTTELNKLAERCFCHPFSSSVREVENAGEAILKLLAINAELVEALDELVEIVQHAIDNRSTADMDSFTLQPARAALAKAEGGEL